MPQVWQRISNGGDSNLIRWVVLETDESHEEVWEKTFSTLTGAILSMIEEAKKYDDYEGHTDFPRGISANDTTYTAHKVTV